MEATQVPDYKAIADAMPIDAAFALLAVLEPARGQWAEPLRDALRERSKKASVTRALARYFKTEAADPGPVITSPLHVAAAAAAAEHPDKSLRDQERTGAGPWTPPAECPEGEHDYNRMRCSKCGKPTPREVVQAADREAREQGKAVPRGLG